MRPKVSGAVGCAEAVRAIEAATATELNFMVSDVCVCLMRGMESEWSLEWSVEW